MIECSADSDTLVFNVIKAPSGALGNHSNWWDTSRLWLRLTETYTIGTKLNWGVGRCSVFSKFAASSVKRSVFCFIVGRFVFGMTFSDLSSLSYRFCSWTKRTFSGTRSCALEGIWDFTFLVTKVCQKGFISCLYDTISVKLSMAYLF